MKTPAPQTHEALVLRRIKRLYIATVGAYAALAAAFTAMAYGQSGSVAVPLASRTFLSPPTGSSEAVVQRYFDYLHLQTLGNLGQTTSIYWVGWLEAFAFGGAFLIALYFLVFAWFARRTRGDLYPVEVYNGYITERNGGVDPFNWAVYAIVLIYAVLYIAMSLRFGQIY